MPIKFEPNYVISSKVMNCLIRIGELFGFKPRTSAALCASWVESGFLIIVDSSNKGRKYKLSAKYQKLINMQELI